jgi:uncharacterized protein (UPF0335 family)
MTTRAHYRLRCALERRQRLEAEIRTIDAEIIPLERDFRKERGLLVRLHPDALRKEVGL